MCPRGQESSARKLVWVEGQNVAGWGCSECLWIFNPSGPPIGNSLEEMKQNFEVQLSHEFESHTCGRCHRAASSH
jgi:rubredoxin